MTPPMNVMWSVQTCNVQSAVNNRTVSHELIRASIYLGIPIAMVTA